MRFKENNNVTGDFTIRVIDKHGKVVSEDTEKNLVVTTGKTSLARLLGGDVTNRNVNRIGFGIGTSAADPADTALSSPVLKTVGVGYPTATQVSFAWTLEYAEGNGLAITEFGLLTVGGSLFSRRVRAALNKTIDIRIEGSWVINF